MMSKALARLRGYLRSMPWTTALRMLALQGVRKTVMPEAKPSFANWGEDRVITHFLPAKGWYVDVGCNHPIANSNTWLLYGLGWRGICIDGNEELIALHRRVRPADRQVCAIVSDVEQDLDFTIFEGTLVSSVDPVHVAKWRHGTAILRTERRRAQTLTRLLDAHGAPEAFDLLSVDVEGHDLQVLRSLDLHRYRPRLIVVEIHWLDLREASSHPVVRHLAEYGYRLVGYLVWNAWFLRAS